ncbi:triphosphoribosyl-dephospho-CoA synthase [Mangrovicella endophytica]|uniref:triphosphoribosyl-dephospho-CoA synthase n=1 Tax=Mangrovicella endophytica TaxID=2066697 RepID=UPI0018E45B9A|nr:triphosphoribosyl-dephospho-CoA synthase [Mangrovicella endophytica]
MSLSQVLVAEAFEAACLAELEALKPGNVHRHASGHGMDAAHFEAAAAAAAPFIAAKSTRIGTRILGAVRASWAATGLNTNLGILLLCAPLAAAAEQVAPSGDPGADADALRAAVRAVLGALGEQDAADVFAAIALASPGGLGTAPEHDVHAPPAIGLVKAMQVAESRDLVARQYAGGYAEIWRVGLPCLLNEEGRPATDSWATIRCFLAFAGAFPDSHIARKYGAEVAADVQRRMQTMGKHLKAHDHSQHALALLASLDAELKAERLNPGTSADLTVATLFIAKLLESLAQPGR